MHKFFSNKKLIVLILTLIASMGFIAFSISVRTFSNTPVIIQQVGNDTVGLLDRIVSVPARGLKSVFTSVHKLGNTYEENEALKKQVDDLAAEKVHDKALKDENVKLKSQLKLNETLTDYGLITANVLSRLPETWQQVVVIDRGSVNGIQKNMPVLSGAGLVGRVSEVNKTNSKVELLSNTSKLTNRFSALVQTEDGKNTYGVITGYDRDTQSLILGQMSTSSNLKEGEKVVTSGLGGLSPKGLLIGEITKVKKDSFGLAKEAFIKPAVNFEDFNFVTVVDRQVESGD